MRHPSARWRTKKKIKNVKDNFWKFSFVTLQWHVSYCSSNHRNARWMWQRLGCREIRRTMQLMASSEEETWSHQVLLSFAPSWSSQGRAQSRQFDGSKTPFLVLTVLKIAMYLRCKTNWPSLQAVFYTSFQKRSTWQAHTGFYRICMPNLWRDVRAFLFEPLMDLSPMMNKLWDHGSNS